MGSNLIKNNTLERQYNNVHFREKTVGEILKREYSIKSKRKISSLLNIK